MKIKILNKFNYQAFPLTDDMVEVSDEELEQIGKTLQFDVENQKVTPYEKPTKTEKELYQEKLSRYPRLVEKYIRQKYTLSAELAILRQRDSKPEEFEEYNNYAEECKLKAKTELGIE